MNDSTAELTWEIFTSDPLRTVGDDPPPGQQYRTWPPISSTLIAGRNSAVLVDAPITTIQAGALADRVAATGKSLPRRAGQAGRLGGELVATAAMGGRR